MLTDRITREHFNSPEISLSSIQVTRVQESKQASRVVQTQTYDHQAHFTTQKMMASEASSSKENTVRILTDELREMKDELSQAERGRDYTLSSNIHPSDIEKKEGGWDKIKRISLGNNIRLSREERRKGEMLFRYEIDQFHQNQEESSRRISTN